ncbi:MAG: DUF2530 domain-containing protein [Actinobacteria bacterium]|nr:DUF2530 domain-containing protein [Actinomycetota bacterium]
MKFYVKSSERKPDPTTLETNPRPVMLVGVLIWVALLGLFVAVPATVPASRPWWPFTCVFGVVLGVLALIRYRRK